MARVGGMPRTLRKTHRLRKIVKSERTCSTASPRRAFAATRGASWKARVAHKLAMANGGHVSQGLWGRPSPVLRRRVLPWATSMRWRRHPEKRQQSSLNSRLTRLTDRTRRLTGAGHAEATT
jgi:hypothetical protein